MKRFLTILFASAMVLIMSAQPHRPQQHERFSPEKFQSALEQYIKQEVQLTSQDASKFFSVYKEMHQKQRPLFDRQKSLAKAKPQDEEGCRKAIEERDAIDLELKRIQQNYHKRFLELLPASKVYDILKAEQRFYRHAMKNWGQQRGKHGQPARK